MKVLVHEKGVVFVGKAWQIRQLIKKYKCSYQYVKEWIDHVHS
jgi:Mother cell inhibitor of FtsZ